MSEWLRIHKEPVFEIVIDFGWLYIIFGPQQWYWGKFIRSWKDWMLDLGPIHISLEL